MKSKKILPHIITAVLSIVLLFVAIISTTTNTSTTPFSLMEKLGIYSSDSGFAYGIANNSFSANGTHELFLSLLKQTAVNNTINGFVPIAILSIAFVAVLVFALSSASKTKYGWTTYLCAVLLPLVFCDFTNLVYFKSLFSNPLVLILLILISAMFLRFYKNESIGLAGIVLLTVATVAYSCLGTVQALTAIVLGVLVIRLYKLCKNKTSAISAIFLGTIVIIQSLVFTANFKSVDYKQSLYNSVFYGVCKYDSVTEIDLDPKLDDFKEVYYGMMENEDEYNLEDTFYSKVSYKTLLKYYITHPSNTIKLINNEAKVAFYTVNEYTFTPYSTVKKLYIPSGLSVVLIIAAVYIIVAMFVGKKFKNLMPVAEFLSGMAIMWVISLIAATIQNGNSDILTNTYTFNVIFDILLVSAAVGGIRVMLAMRDDKKEKFGITHE